MAFSTSAIMHADLLEFGDAKAARGRRRRAQTQTRGDERGFRIEGNAVLVAGDGGADQRLLGDVALEALGPQIDQHQMVVGAAGDDVEAVGAQAFRQRLGVLDHVLGVDLEVRTQRFGERHRLGRDHMHQRAALQAREDRRVHLLGDRPRRCTGSCRRADRAAICAWSWWRHARAATATDARHRRRGRRNAPCRPCR